MIADFHIHSRFSRATSKALNFENLEKYARIKGVDILGTGDFMHPEWQQEIKKELSEDESGILKSKSGFPFVLQNEISLMYKKGEKGRRIHLVILAPNLEVVNQITDYFKKLGRIDYDGRPIFGKSCVEVTEELKNISKEIEIIPAHIWTPWFGLFGSKSGFNSIKEAFEDKAEEVHAIETGLSSDPEMNWKIKELNKRAILSFSDAHSSWPWRLGREATVFSKANSYKKIIKQIRENRIEATVEVEPAYGKYHWDGHRLCNFSCSPEETKKLSGICPKCGKLLTIGVENRVEELADQKPEENPNRKKFYKLLPLHELISAVKASSLSSQKTWQIYNQFIEKLGNEFNVLLKADEKELAIIDKKLAGVIMQNREGKIKVKPGYDGVYGEALLSERQKKLF